MAKTAELQEGSRKRGRIYHRLAAKTTSGLVGVFKMAAAAILDF